MKHRITTIHCPLCRDELKPHYRGTSGVSEESAVAECPNCGVLVTLTLKAVLDSKKPKR